MRKAFSFILAVLFIFPVLVFPGFAAADDTSAMEAHTVGSKPVSFLLPEGSVLLRQEQELREESCAETESLMFRCGSCSLYVEYGRSWGSAFDMFALGYFGTRDVIPAEMESAAAAELETAFTMENSGIADYGFTEADGHPAVWCLIRQTGMADAFNGAVIIVSGGSFIRLSLSMQHTSGDGLGSEDQELFLKVLNSFALE